MNGLDGVARSRYVRVDGVRTHYLEAGEGPPLVLLHSGEFGGCAEFSWEHNIPSFAEQFRVIAPDWLGFGRTDKLHDFESKSDRMIRHMASFLEIMDIDEDQPADFCGHSMGGSMLIREAARGGRCRLPIRRMVTASGGGFVPDNEFRRLTLTYDGTAEHMQRMLEGGFSDAAWWTDEDYVRRRVKESLRPGAWESVAAARFKAPNVPERSQFGHPDQTPYEAIEVPVLLTAGAEDKLRLPGWTKGLGDRIPQVEVLLVDGVGHNVNIEAADIFNEATLRFLGAQEPVPRKAD